jgi:signal recognition particle subunit SRP54
VFRRLSGRGRISEENVREALREVRTALLEADVNFKVVRTSPTASREGAGAGGSQASAGQ